MVTAPEAGAELAAADLVAVLGTPDAPLVVDVREPDEFASWAIPGARNVPLSTLEAQLGSVPRSGPVVVVCASGARSARATALLRAAGVDAANLTGGMAAWSGVYDEAPATAGPFDVVQLRRRGKGCLSYVVGAGGAAVVIDPSTDVSRYEAVARSHGWRITGVADTHLHADHVSGARMLADAGDVPLYRGSGDPVSYPYEPLSDGSTVAVGDASLVVWAAPGHTGGSIVLEAPDGSLFTGDTLFVDGVGRPDLADHAEEDAHRLARTIARLRDGRPDTATLYPAHYGDQVALLPGVPVRATLAEVRARVPQLEWDEERFAAWAAGRAAPRPPRYEEIVRVNTGERALSVEDCRSLELGPNRCAAA